MKGKKKTIIIGAIAAVLLIGLIVGGILLTGPKEEKDLKEPTTTNSEKTPTAPAQSTESLTETMEKAETVAISKDTIEFAESAKVEEGELIAVWVYSKPKFLGYFKVVLNDGKKVIEGLEEALEKLDIEPGDHNIALVKEDGEELGYIDVKIEKEGIKPETFVEEEKEEIEEEKEPEKEEEKTTTKTIKVNEEIKYSTTKQNEVNMKRGTTEVITAGVKGNKEVTYEVTYNSAGKEISRKKVSEKTTKQPVNEVIKVGTSDFNINTDTTRGTMAGPACTKDKTYDAPYDGALHCNDEMYTDLPQFSATIMAGKIIITSIGGQLSTAVIATPVNDYVFMGTYNGQTYYFDNRMGDGEPGKLTLEFCNKYNLNCGAW